MTKRALPVGSEAIRYADAMLVSCVSKRLIFLALVHAFKAGYAYKTAAVRRIRS